VFNCPVFTVYDKKLYKITTIELTNMSFFINALKNLNIVCPKTIIETGTYMGEGIRNYLHANYFSKIYSIELSNKYYLLNKEQFKNHNNVYILEGDSSKVISNLITCSILDNEPILFYLDAHFSGGDTSGEFLSNGCPILSELEAIASRNVVGDIIIVDDMRLMGKATWGGTENCTEYPKTFYDFTHVSDENIFKALSKRKISLINMIENTDRLLIVLDGENKTSDSLHGSQSMNVWQDKTETHYTKYGLVTLYKNEAGIGSVFKRGGYWDIDTLLKLREYINPDRNILEIGGHCGTSSIVYSSFLNNKKKIYVYEPQFNMYSLLVHNITQNNLQDKIIPNNLGVFCFEGNGKMNSIDLDGGGGIVEKRYNEESNFNCNFGGIGLGNDGENIKLTTIDNMKIDDIGYIHCDAQGSENFLFSNGIETIKKNRPVILYENIEFYGTYLYDNICNSYPSYKEESMFDIKKYCMEQLNYSKFIDRFNGGIDTLLIP
jgi:FkbM family methyltransferase